MTRAGWAMTALWVLFLLGAVLMTGVLGGALASHWRVGSPLFSHTLFGVYLGAFMWLALYLRDARFRAYVGSLVR